MNQAEAQALEIPNKPLLHVTEVVRLTAPYLGRSYATVERQIYRGIEAGTIDARVILGRLMIEREEVDRIIQGDPA